MLKACLLGVLICFCSLAVTAQKEGKVLSKEDSLLSEWKKKADVKTAALDSASSKTLSKTDKAISKVDSSSAAIQKKGVSISNLLTTGTSGQVMSKEDSLQKKFMAGEKSLQSAENKLTHSTDSLNRNLSEYEQKMNQVKGRLTHRIDSLKKLNLPTERYSSLLDSLNKSGPAKSLKEAQAKLNALESKMKEPVGKVNQSVNKLSGKVNEKIGAFNSEGANIPGATMPGLNTAKLNQSIPGATNPLSGVNTNLPTTGLNNSLPNTNLPASGLNSSIPGTNTKVPTTGLSGSGNNLGGTTGLSSLKINQPKIQLPSADISKATAQMKGASVKMKNYSKDLKSLKAGELGSAEQLSKDAEKKALSMANTKELTSGQSQVNQAKSMMDKAGDQKAMQQMGKTEIQKQAMNHFKGQEQVLQQAMNKMSTYKKKYSQLASLKDTLKRPPNPMHDKPFIERIVPGLTFQIISTGSNVTIDFNPSVFYRLSGRINLGAGWVQRIYFNQKSANNAVYGIRTFGDFKLGKGFAARADLENISVIIPQPNPGSGPNDSGQRRWEMNLFTGLKKDFTLYKSVRGNVQTTYRIWGSQDQTPYSDRLQVRIGFEFPMKRKGKK